MKINKTNPKQMSIIYCDKCDKYIDTDLDCEHFDEEVKDLTHCGTEEGRPQYIGTKEKWQEWEDKQDV